MHCLGPCLYEETPCATMSLVVGVLNNWYSTYSTTYQPRPMAVGSGGNNNDICLDDFTTTGREVLNSWDMR